MYFWFPQILPKNKQKQVNLRYQVKFGLSEKHTKFDKMFFMDLTNQLSKHQNHKEDFFKLCVLLKKSEFYGKVDFLIYSALRMKIGKYF